MLNVLLALWVSASAAFAFSFTYTGFYTGEIIPTPQEAKIASRAWEIGSRGRMDFQILVPPQAAPVIRLAAEEIAGRVQYLCGAKPPIREGTRLPTHGVFVALGFRDLRTPPSQPEGYAISPWEKGAARGLIAVGRDAAGLTFAAQTLKQLFEGRGSRVFLHPACIRDWPIYRLRSFKTGGAYDPGGPVMEMAAFAPFAKFNCYNICYTTLGPNLWVAPPEGYRRFVQETTCALRARGLDCMPFINPYYGWKEHIETADAQDRERLFETCRIGLEAGGGRVMLCLDDFASEPDWQGPKLYHVRSPRDREQWGDDLAAVNAALISDLARRLKAAYPRARLYIVPPYYWTPAGSYRAEGERYLQAVAAALPWDVRFVWTGPLVRSAVITTADVAHYQALLGGRRVMLWDNTLYMHHNPPHYLFDPFRTKYPPRFWELASGEVHLNAGSGEIYKCGLLSAADYLWNPQAFEPERSLRRAIAALAGPTLVDELLAFRDAFYKIYDEYSPRLGPPQTFLAAVQSRKSSPFAPEALAEFEEALAREKQLAEQISRRCANRALAAEILERACLHDPYREALAHLRALPLSAEAKDPANLAPNPGAEEPQGDRPAHWGLYQGAGAARLDRAPGRQGGFSGRLTATSYHEWNDGRRSINVALMIGETNGYDGRQAPPVEPLCSYYYSFWIKGTAPRVVVSFVTWDERGTVASRAHIPLLRAPLGPMADWTFVSGSFITPVTAARGALKIAIEGFTEEGGGLGEICVDDVYVGRSRAASLASQSR